MRTLGIDFDTNAVHVVALEEGGAATYQRFDLPAVGDAFERTREIADVLPPRHGTFWDEVLAVGIEEPQGVQKATVAKLKAVQGAILSCIPRRVVCEPMVPARWRTAVGLKGNAQKQDVALFAVGRGFMPTPPTQDAYDAFCLALAVSTLVEKAA